MNTLLRPFFTLLLVFSLHAQTKLPKYAVLKTEGGEAYLTSVNQLSDEGYRLIVAGKFTILRLEATPPDTYRYLRLEVKGGPAQFTNWINEQSAHGYRWLSRTELLEKAPHPRNYEYRWAQHGALGPAKSAELSSLLLEGYRPVGIVSFSHTIGADTEEMFFEREVGQSAFDSHLRLGSEIQVADAMRAGNVMKHVDELANQGYRFLGLHNSSKGGGIAVMMEKCGDDCAGRYQYRYFDAKSAPQVERDLNAQSRDGFRVLADALRSRPHLLERDTREARKFSYRALDPKDSAELGQELNAADLEGYVPLDFVWHLGWTAEGLLILERQTTASATP